MVAKLEKLREKKIRKIDMKMDAKIEAKAHAVGLGAILKKSTAGSQSQGAGDGAKGDGKKPALRK